MGIDKIPLEEKRFIKVIDMPAGTTGPTLSALVDLQTLKRTFGRNYNTITILNTDTTISIEVQFAKGEAAMLIPAGNGSWSFDWESGIIFTDLAIINTHAASTLTNANIKISIGRTGPREETGKLIS